MQVGILLLLISVFSILSVLFLHFSIGRYLKNKRILYIILGFLYLAYFISIRYTYDLKQFFELRNVENLKEFFPYDYSFSFSRILLLDLCPMISILLPISLIFDKTNNVSKVLSLYGILGGVITLCGMFIDIKEINISLVKFIFIGEEPNILMFSGHLITLLLSLMVLLNAKKFTKWSVLGTLLFILVYISYILSMSKIFDIECNTTGLREGDWINPYPFKFWYSEYKFLQDTLNIIYPYNVVFWYLIGMLIVITMIIFKNILTFNKENRNTKLWWSKLYKIDCFLNNLLGNKFKQQFIFI